MMGSTIATGESRELRPLTPKEQVFVELYVSGEQGRASARKAGYTGTDGAIDVTVSRLLRRAPVRAAIRLACEAKARATAGTIMSREERELWLSNVVRASGEFAKAELPQRIRAAELLARMNGDFATVLIPGRMNAPAPEEPPPIEGEGREVSVVNIYLPENGR